MANSRIARPIIAFTLASSKPASTAVGSKAVVGLYNEGNTVEQVCHSTKEKASLTNDHGTLCLACENFLTERSDIRNTRRDVALCGSPTGHTVLFYEVSDIGSCDLALLNSKSSDHLIVCFRNIASASRFLWISGFCISGEYLSISVIRETCAL